MMHNSNVTKFVNDPKLELLVNLTRQCYLDKQTNHSFVLDEDVGDVGGDTTPWCPKTFDGFSCWDPTPAGVTAVQPCPNFVVGFDSRRLAYKRCTENGTWYLHPEGKRPWTNYTTCIDVEDLSFRNMVNNIYVTGYSISVAALLLSIIIFVYFRSLRCTRINVHMHLFASFALNGALWIIWYKTVVSFVSVVQENQSWCQALHVLMHYFMVTSYMWMFCEGLHLHIALIVVFVKDETAMRWFIGLGWGLPLLLIGIYASVRVNTLGATERCWMDHSDTFWIIIVPVLISLVASFVFLVNIVRVLVTKLPTSNHQSPATAKKAVRAALILIPLFGLHFMLIPLRPLPDAPGEKTYQVISALLTSLQDIEIIECGFDKRDDFILLPPTFIGYEDSESLESSKSVDINKKPKDRRKVLSRNRRKKVHGSDIFKSGGKLKLPKNHEKILLSY